MLSLDPSLAGYSQTRTREVYRAVLRRVQSLPGVAAASLASIVPYGDISEGGRATLPEGSRETDAYFTIVTSDYFETLLLPVLRGRGFSAAEDERVNGILPALVNDRLAGQLFGDEDPIGRPFAIGRRAGEPPETLQVAGVVASVTQDLFEEPEPHVYVPYGSHFRAGMTLHVAVARSQDEAALLATIQRELRQLDPRVPVLTARTMTTQRNASLAHWAVRAAAVMFSTFGALALLLAALGVYGLKAYDVARRTREIGIRLALGATARNVMTLVLRDGMVTTALGLGGGLLVALGLGRLVSGLLYRVGPFDLLTILVAAAVLAGANFVATYFPARRAARMAPLQALRTE